MDRTQSTRGGAARLAAEIRPATPADAPALGVFFAGLSGRTRARRFFAPIKLTQALLARLSGGGGTTDAIVATQGGVIIGHAMAVDRPASQGGQETDIGVVVADAWQSRGVGSALVRALISRAQARGVESMAMQVLPANHQVLAMIEAHWTSARAGHSADSVNFRVLLPYRHTAADPVPSVLSRTSNPAWKAAAANCGGRRQSARRPAVLARAGLPPLAR